MEPQEELFNKMKSSSSRIDMFADHLRIDFNNILEHGINSISNWRYVRQGIVDWENGLDKLITELYYAKAKGIEILQDCLKKYEEE